MSWNWERTSTIAVKDGIRSQSGKVGRAASWWGERWLKTLSDFGWDSRLARGRSYARRGQVTQLEIRAGEVSAKVQGSRPTPYNCRIALKRLSEPQWENALQSVADSPLIQGQLLAGELPSQIEPIFLAEGAPLFPTQSQDLAMSCSCPDYAVPCKHLAAVYFLVAEWLDRDPFLLLELRGRDRESILAALRVGSEGPVAPEPDEPLDLDTFWSGGPFAPGRTGTAMLPLALLRALGEPPGWTDASLAVSLKPLYAAVSAAAKGLLNGTDKDDVSSDIDDSR
jgi:uncharacterized Zn finger protein